MYQFLNDNGGRGYTWNPIRGKCPHDCSYCYMKRYPQPELHLDEKSLHDDLGQGNFIFVGSSCDMWADAVNSGQINRILNSCILARHNQYLFQSKNPKRFMDFLIPPGALLGTTIETNRTYSHETYKAPYRQDRYQAMVRLKSPKMISIEPIMDFDLELMVDWIAQINPEFVSVGADSGNNRLPEPSWPKVQSLIRELEQFTEVKLKDNLTRLRQSFPAHRPGGER